MLLILDGVYATHAGRRPQFVPVAAPTVADLEALIDRISRRIGRHLQRRGLLMRDAENAYLDWDAEQASPLDDLAGHAITYRIAVGPNRGQKAFTLQTLPAVEAEPARPALVAGAGGFSLHAGVVAEAYQRDKLERLCRYVTRPAVAEPRLSLTAGGRIRYSLKTPWRDGTTHVVFEPLDFIARLAALVPRPRVNLTRFHGVFAPNSRWRAQVTPAGRGRRRPADADRTSGRPHNARPKARRWSRRPTAFSTRMAVAQAVSTMMTWGIHPRSSSTELMLSGMA